MMAIGRNLVVSALGLWVALSSRFPTYVLGIVQVSSECGDW